jgi:hypothetical protein
MPNPGKPESTASNVTRDRNVVFIHPPSKAPVGLFVLRNELFWKAVASESDFPFSIQLDFLGSNTSAEAVILPHRSAK